MEPTVEATVLELAGAADLRARSEMLVLEGLGRHELACETLYTALSPGTELAAWEGHRPLRPDRTYSRVVGYCNLARVVTTGEWVRRARPGDLVLTLQSHRSHFVCGEDEILVRLPPDGDHDPDTLVHAATTYLFHQGHSALLRGDLKPGQYVAVVGMGTLGLATVAVANRFGAKVVGLSDLERSRRTASEMGAERVFCKDLDTSLQAEIAGLTRGTGIDLVVLTSGRWQDYRLALELVRPGGSVCVLGFPGRRDPIPPFNPLEPTIFYRKQISLIACGYTPDVDVDPRDLRFTIRRNTGYLLDLVLAGELPAARLVSAVEPWHALPELYRRIAAREPGFYTGVLRWAGEDLDPDRLSTGADAGEVHDARTDA